MRFPHLRFVVAWMLLAAAAAAVMVGAALHKRNRDYREPPRSPEEAAVIEIARKAVTQRWGDQPAVYDVKRSGDLWTVHVWWIIGYDWQGHPRITPGGFCTVPIDTDGRVYEIILGE